MVADDTAIYLSLAPEFGGGQFGPFQDLEIRLGADNRRCHIHIPEDFGTAREHCKLLRQRDSGLILAPAERTAPLYIWKGDARRPVQVLTPTAIQSGDAFSLVSPEGPKFFVKIGKMPQAARSGPLSMAAAARKRFTLTGILGEVQRVFIATLYTFSPFAMAARVKMAVESGLIFTPRFIVSAMLLLSGWIMAAPTGCAMMKYKSDLTKTQAKAEACEEREAFKGDGDSNPLNMSTIKLMAAVLNDNVGTALATDPVLYGKVDARAKAIFDNPGSYDWLYTGQGASLKFKSWREKIEKVEDIDPSTRELLPWLAATPGRRNTDFQRTLDSANKQVCGRGPIRLTWRQARHLGMETIFPDALIQDSTYVITDQAQNTAKLLGTIAADTSAPPPSDPAIQLESGYEDIIAGQESCIFQTGDDDREEESKLIKMMRARIGPTAPGLPDVQIESNTTAVARVARLFAADSPNLRFEKEGSGQLLSFAKGTISSVLADIGEKDWILDRTAEIVARAIVLPCIGALKKDQQEDMKKILGTLPDELTCLVLYYRMSSGSVSIGAPK